MKKKAKKPLGGRKLVPRTVKKRCESGKTCYPNRLEAQIALADIKYKDSTRRGKQEKRSYFHKACGCWHLTSAPKFERAERADHQ